jgi:SNF2 family DNA or RNA helicase
MGERQDYVSEFQNDPDVRLIVLSLNAGKVGLTLTAASNVAFAELGWTPADMVQAVDRCHRIGQQDAVTGWQLIAANSIDFYMAELLRDKKDIMDQILDGKAPAEAGESILDDLIRMMKS